MTQTNGYDETSRSDVFIFSLLEAKFEGKKHEKLFSEVAEEFINACPSKKIRSFFSFEENNFQYVGEEIDLPTKIELIKNHEVRNLLQFNLMLDFVSIYLSFNQLRKAFQMMKNRA